MVRVCLVLLIGCIFSTAVFASDELHFWTPDVYDEPTIAWFKQVIFAEYERATGVKVVLGSVPFDPYELDMVLAQGAATGLAPDVVLLPHMGEWQGQAGWLMPLNKYFDQWRDRSEIPQSLLPRADAFYAVPFEIFVRLGVYHKAVFQSVGLDPEDVTRSWDGILSATEKLTEIVGNQIRRVGYYKRWQEPPSVHFEDYLLQSGGSLFSADGRRVTFHWTEGIEAAAFLSALYGLVHLAGVPARDIDWDVFELFTDGQIGIMDAVPGLVYAMVDETGLSRDDIGVFVGRKTSETTPAAKAYAHGIAIPSSTKDPDAAWRFIEWLFQPDVYSKMISVSNHIGTRLDTAATIIDFRPDLAPWYHALPYVISPPSLPPSIAIKLDWDGLDDGLTRILKNQSNPHAVLNDMASRWQSELIAAWEDLGEAAE